MVKLAGAAVVVTGASRGIGHGIAEELGARGARIVVNYARSREAAEDLAEHLMQNGSPQAVAIQADVSDPAQATRLIEETVKSFGRIDVLINNAGINIDRTMKKLTIEDWNTVIQNDLNSYFYTIKAAQPFLLEQKSGAIVNISSFVGLAGNFGQANYAAAKAGIFGLTKTAALEFARYGVRVNAVAPGFTETDMMAAMPERARDAALAKIPLGRFGTAQDIAKSVRFLIEDADYITGHVLNVSGGIYM
ncbi:MAG: 3-oxoacyl-ACP reductase FabG [Ktedonobacteraceae bacterium]|nr:3-oxoacyl-ACP reductase FabG [Ktedonobacteraceae bacterium]MBV9713352.1 3-oxoacyl-ACP reductase FabG [Ktedonobacteraceae bacterium]